MANTHLSRTPSVEPTSRYKGTLSVWVKRGKADAESFIFYGFESNSNKMKIDFKSDSSLQINTVQAASNRIVYETNRKFRDVNAWYHIVVAIDTTLATAGDRVRLYVNGVEETSFSTETHPAQNSLHMMTDNGTPIYIGSENGGNYFNGSMSHYHLIDGTQYTASDFGETDATTGEWKIKTSPSVTYGNNGFWILKDGNSVTDASPNTNNLTVSSGTLTKTEDNPSNVFATWNVLGQTEDKGNLSNGNLTYDRPGASDNWVTIPSTLATNSGKWYYEYKIIDGGASTGNGSLTGLLDYHTSNLQHTATALTNAGEYGWYGASGNLYINGTDVAQISSYTDGDIVMVAVDLDNAKIYWGKNGTWINSGDPTSGSTGTGGFTIANVSSGAFAFAVSHREGGNGTANFGNGYFGTTAVSSAGTNASGNGIFEYDVPTGYTALSTKGLNL